jgi:hypothetical protein
MRTQRATRRRIWLGLAAFASMMATQVQSAPLPGFALVSQTEHFFFYSRNPHLRIDADKAEQSLREFSAMLGQPVEGRTEFFRHERAEDVAVYTGVYSTGYAEGNGERMHSTLPNHPHEIVHIVTFRMGQPGDFFQEGLAVALGDHGKINGISAKRIAKSALTHYSAATTVAAFHDVDPTSAYAIAGAFVEHLIQAQGIAKVAELFRACPNGPSQRDAAFARIFGHSLDTELASWSATL